MQGGALLLRDAGGDFNAEPYLFKDFHHDSFTHKYADDFHKHADFYGDSDNYANIDHNCPAKPREFLDTGSLFGAIRKKGNGRNGCLQ